MSTKLKFWYNDIDKEKKGDKMEEYKVKYNAWLNDPAISEEDKQDLRNIQNDEKNISDYFNYVASA